MKSWIILIVAVALTLFSLLTVLHAQTTFLWVAAIGADEFGQFFIPLAILLLVYCFYRNNLRFLINKVTAVLSLVALCCLIKPTLTAFYIASHLNKDLVTAFDSNAAIEDNLNIIKLFKVGISQKIVPKTLVYTGINSKYSLNLDFYKPDSINGTPYPCIIVIHGGSWHGGDKLQLSDINSLLALKGYAVASIDYRLAPEAQWPCQKDDVLDAVNYIKSHSNELNIDATKLVLLGRSAGAQLATSVAYLAKDKAIKGVISIYGPQDLKFAWDHRSPRDVLDTYSIFKAYLGGSPSEFPESYKESSAIMNVSSESPPMLLIHGKLDTLVWYKQSERMDIKLTEFKVPHYYLSLPWATHGFDYNLNGPGGQLELITIDSFLNYLFKSSKSYHSSLK